VKNAAFSSRWCGGFSTQRNKKVDNALAPFLKSTFKLSKEEAKKRACALPLSERRVRELTPKIWSVSQMSSQSKRVFFDDFVLC